MPRLASSETQGVVNYNNSLRVKREYKQRQARLAGAASDQSVCVTDTDVPLDEPSVPVQNVHFDSLGQQQCLVSEEVVVSAGPSTEVAPSDVLLLPARDSLDKLAASIFSRLSNLQSARGPHPPVQSNSVGSGISQQGVILPNVCQPSVQSHSVGSGISQPGVILPNVCQPVFADADFAGVAASPQLFPNTVQPVFRLPTAPVSGETPHRPIASDQRIKHLQEELASTCQASSTLLASGVRPPQSLFDSASSLARDLEDARLSSSRPGVSSSAKPTSAQSGPARPESTLLFLVHLGDGPLTRLSVPRDTHLARGVILLPARDVGSLAIRLRTRIHRLRLADNGTINRMKRTIFVLPHWIFF